MTFCCIQNTHAVVSVIQVDPDYIEYFYKDQKPMVHYVYALIENMTNVAAYLLNKESKEEMQAIDDSTNLQCKQNITEEGMAKYIMIQLEQYGASFNHFMESRHKDPTNPTIIPNDMVNELVECN